MGNGFNNSTVSSQFLKGSGATDRGTRIVKQGSDMDKNAFLKILSAELSNQDPMSNADSTKYISQMAQFTAMEQMTNLNQTMSGFVSNSLIGKAVTLKNLDDDGKPYTGIVKGVTNKPGGSVISVEVKEKGKSILKDFEKNDIATVLDTSNYSLKGIGNNMTFLLASSFIGKEVEVNDKSHKGTNEKLKGTVISTFKEKGLVKVAVKLQGNNKVKNYNIDDVTKISENTNGKVENNITNI